MANALTKLFQTDDREKLAGHLVDLQAKRTYLVEKRRGYEASQRTNAVAAVDGDAKARTAVESANAAVRKATDEIATIDLAIDETRQRLAEADRAARRTAWEGDLARLKALIKARGGEVGKIEEALQVLAAALPAQQELAGQIQDLALQLGSPVTAEGTARVKLHFADVDQSKWRMQMYASQLGLGDASARGWFTLQATDWQKDPAKTWGDLEGEEHRRALAYAMSGKNRPDHETAAAA